MFYSLQRQLTIFIMVVVFVYSSCSGDKKETYQSNKTVHVETNTNINPDISFTAEMIENNTNLNVEKENGERCNLKGNLDPFNLPIISKHKDERPKIIDSATAAFIADKLIPENKKNLGNYEIELRQNSDCFFVYFSPRKSRTDILTPSEGGETSLGKAVMFVISKKDKKIKSRYFFK